MYKIHELPGFVKPFFHAFLYFFFRLSFSVRPGAERAKGAERHPGESAGALWSFL
jgi:hypothetical protein